MEKIGKESIPFEWYEDHLNKRFCKRCHRVVKKLNGKPCADVLLDHYGLLVCPGCGWSIGKRIWEPIEQESPLTKEELMNGLKMLEKAQIPREMNFEATMAHLMDEMIRENELRKEKE